MSTLRTALYVQQAKLWPTDGRHIMAQFDDHSIVVYQAYNEAIAVAATKANNFHSNEILYAGYNPNRMSWIKTSFLWMMYRSGWATKPNQTRILAIRITRQGFEDILLNAATKGPSLVRLQWDPSHAPNGDKIPASRAIQLGLRGNILDRFSREFLLSITDITPFVREQAGNVSAANDSLVIPVEDVYQCLNPLAGNRVLLEEDRGQSDIPVN